MLVAFLSVNGLSKSVAKRIPDRSSLCATYVAPGRNRVFRWSPVLALEGERNNSIENKMDGEAGLSCRMFRFAQKKCEQ